MLSPAFFVAHWYLLLLLAFTGEGDGLKIVNLAVPMSLPNTTDSGLLLDCDYSLELGSVDGLVVKWFINDAPNPVYQWIQGRKPQDLGLLKGRVDLDYRVSDDPRKMYRAVKIRETSGDLSGDYTCSVSTFEDEARQTKRMTIYTPPSKFEFWEEEGGSVEDEVKLRCLATDVYPEPRFNITTSDKSGAIHMAVNASIEIKDGLWDAEAKLTVNKKDLTSKTSFYCVLTIPETDYILKKSINIPPAMRATRKPLNFRTSQVSEPETVVTAPNHYDPDIFFIRTYTEGTNSGSSVEAAVFSIFLLSFLNAAI